MATMAIASSQKNTGLPEELQSRAVCGMHNGRVDRNQILNYRTDVEPDDLQAYTKFLQMYDRDTKDLRYPPTINVIVSEGTSEKTLQEKTDMLRLFALDLVDRGVIEERVLDALKFYESGVNPRVDGSKTKAWEKLHNHAMHVFPHLNQRLAEYSRKNQTESLESFEKEFSERFSQGKVSRIYEVALAPIKDLQRFYEANPQMKQHVRLIAYGSFNFRDVLEARVEKRIEAEIAEGLSIEQQESLTDEIKKQEAQKISDFVNSLGLVAIYEAFEATKYLNDPTNPASKGFSDRNKVGLNANPRAFTVLKQESNNPITKFFAKAFAIWDAPRLDKYIDEDIENLYEKRGFGREFVDALGAALVANPKLSAQEAKTLFDECCQVRKIKPKRMYKYHNKVTQIHSSLYNKGLQGVAADLPTVMMIDPESGLVQDGHVTRSKYTLSESGYSSFEPSEEGNVYTVSAKRAGPGQQYEPGISMEALEDGLRSVFAPEPKEEGSPRALKRLKIREAEEEKKEAVS